MATPAVFYSYLWVFSFPFSQPCLFSMVHCLAKCPLHLAARLLSRPLLPVWVNVSLTPWLSELHAVWFSGTSGCLLFLNWLLFFFWLCKDAQHFYLPLHLVLNFQVFFNSLPSFLDKEKEAQRYDLTFLKYFVSMKHNLWFELVLPESKAWVLFFCIIRFLFQFNL